MTSSVEVIAIFGPTASGKSRVAHELAARLGTEVVSADALQVYRGLPVLTNQPDTPTRLVAIRDPDAEMSVGEYGILAHTAVDELVRASGSAVVTGGTGLYLRAALVDLGVPPPGQRGLRARLEESYDASAAESHARLETLDPRVAASVHPNDRRRVVRALELAESGSSLIPEQDRLWSREYRRPTLVVGLDVPSETLERRIRIRTEEMFARGVVHEARRASDVSVSRTAEKALGLSELTRLPPDQAFERIIVRTRRYAAYQRKWMHRIPGIVMIDGDRNVTEVVDAILEVAGAR
jgi:tRNA dimethylallyltransferase